MEIDDLKKVWTKINNETGQPVYSAEDITNFRKARSKDFSTWIQNGLIIDIILKGVFILAFAVLTILLREFIGYVIIAISTILLSAFLIVVELKYLKGAKVIDRKDISVQEGIKAKLGFLKTYYYRIQFMQGLSNPLFVGAGVSFYYFHKYGAIKIDNFEDSLILILLLLVSFLLTLPTTLSLYGYHYKNLKTSIASLENEESRKSAIIKYEKQTKLLSWVLGSLLLIGLIALVYLILL
jgi:hypothetical protein